MKTEKMKIVGYRIANPNPSWQEANRWLKTIATLRNSKGICPKGVYRFKTFEEADEWMTKMLAIKTQSGPKPAGRDATGFSLVSSTPGLELCQGHPPLLNTGA